MIAKLMIVLAGIFIAGTAWAVTGVTPITTASDFLAVADPDKVGKVPYILSLIALFAIPIVTQIVKQVKELPQWVKWVMPLGISLITAMITSLAQGFAPWSPQGLEIVLAIVMGGLGGQGIFVANKKMRSGDSANN